MNCIIIEDEILAANVLKEYIAHTEDLTLLAICEDATMALTMLSTSAVDLIFLDINLPKISGIDFLSIIQDRYPIVMTTAYHEYAIDAFNLNVIDYLLKPITYPRFLQSIQKVAEFIQHKKASLAGVAQSDYIYVKTSNGLEKITFADIIYIESIQNYIQFVIDGDRKITTYSTLKNMETYLPAGDFVKVQKSFIVNKHKIRRIDGTSISLGGKEISISRQLKDEVMKQILGDKVLKR
jgi:DNA-binding LytR/AlgR family response regulator